MVHTTIYPHTNRKHRKGHVLPFALSDVLFIRGGSNCSYFILKGGKEWQSTYTMVFYGQYLPDHFVRIQRSYIINRWEVKRICEDTKKVQLSDGTELSVSHPQWKAIKYQLQRQ
ncbi:LytTR family transcriptional regulator DNA-binding domain-containing protein [Telluribacter humicola]|uniref:LytTR family transcriptional regulator DNA-binding domain-containing protein n=1 Tax=Telluribacter humicola TaxID=1720261 RepID=UPI001A956379|nr:LytTR family transcriptional regulator DNA-binding domain-containing protein [Telluribacter humicola]